MPEGFCAAAQVNKMRSLGAVRVSQAKKGTIAAFRQMDIKSEGAGTCVPAPSDLINYNYVWQDQCRIKPPVTLMPWPVILSAKSEERYRNIRAMSSSVWGRFRGMPEIRSFQ